MTPSPRYRAAVSSRHGNLVPTVVDTRTGDMTFTGSVEAARIAAAELNEPDAGDLRASFTWRPGGDAVVVADAEMETPLDDGRPVSFNFRFTDRDGDVLDVDRFRDGHANVSTADPCGVDVGPDDAPLLAAAILTATGRDPRGYGLPEVTEVTELTVRSTLS